MVCAKSQNPAPVRQTVEQAKEKEKNPFISEGYVSLNKGGHVVSIQNLRDTRATQSVLVELILPLSKATATGSQALI